MCVRCRHTNASLVQIGGSRLARFSTWLDPLEHPLQPPTKPLSWNEVREFVSTGQLNRLGRVVSDDRPYVEWREETLRKYVSTEAWVLHNVLDYDTRRLDSNQDAQERLDVVRRSEEERRLTPHFKWRRNYFPYSLENNISHNLLWSDYAPALTDDRVQAEATKHLGENVEFLFWVNPDHLRSVKGVASHVHILSRDTSADTENISVNIE